MDRYAIVELMGHKRFGARVSEVECFGAKLMRAEVCGQRPDEFVSEQLVAAGALYRVTFVTEAAARAHNTPFQVQTALPMLPDVAGEALGTVHEDDDDADTLCVCGHPRGSHVAGADECCDDDAECAEECDCTQYHPHAVQPARDLPF